LAGGLSTQNSSAFAIARNIQQVGGTLTTWGDREVVGYTVTTGVSATPCDGHTSANDKNFRSANICKIHCLKSK